jgi:hypothetical protein
MQTNTKKLLENRIIDKLIKISAQLYLGWALFIALLTLLPGQVIPNFHWDFIAIDKLVHIAMFFVMAFLGAIVFNPTHQNKLAKASLLSFLLAVSYGIMLEYFQTFIPQRTFDYADLAANIIGTSLGIAGFFLFQLKTKK